MKWAPICSLLAFLLLPWTGQYFESEAIRELIAISGLVCFAFFITIGHRLLAEQLVDWYQSRFKEESSDLL